jgi:hypothetical protein
MINLRKLNKILLKLIAVTLIVLTMANAMGKNSWKKAIDDTKSELVVGSTTINEAESFFKNHDLTYGFISRESDRKQSPQFDWSSETASGYFRSVIPNVRTNWWKLSYENIEISVEIDHNVVSKVVIEKSFTGL